MEGPIPRELVADLFEEAIVRRALHMHAGLEVYAQTTLGEVGAADNGVGFAA
jgi:hypothetical protein